MLPMDAEQCRRILGEAFPELEIRSVAFESEGWSYEVWQVNGWLVFRFPKRREVIARLGKETELLDELADLVSAPLHRPRFRSQGCDAFPLPFVGYRRLDGTPLSQARLTGTRRREVARGVGLFLMELHRVPPRRAERVGVPGFTPESWRQHHIEFHERMHEEAYALLTTEERAAAETFWTDFISDERMIRFKPVLTHGDLGPEHVLVDETTGSVSGVIDFEDAAVADPAMDLAGFEEPFRRLVLEAYGGPRDEDQLARAAHYRRLVPFHKVMFGVETGDRELIETGLQGIRRRVADRQPA